MLGVTWLKNVTGSGQGDATDKELLRREEAGKSLTPGSAPSPEALRPIKPACPWGIPQGLQPGKEVAPILLAAPAINGQASALDMLIFRLAPPFHFRKWVTTNPTQDPWPHAQVGIPCSLPGTYRFQGLPPLTPN